MICGTGTFFPFCSPLNKNSDLVKLTKDQDYIGNFPLAKIPSLCFCSAVEAWGMHGQRVKAVGADETLVNLTGINNSNPSSTLLRWRTVYIFAREDELTEEWRAKATVSSLFYWGIKFLNCVLKGKVVVTNKLEFFQFFLNSCFGDLI